MGRVIISRDNSAKRAYVAKKQHVALLPHYEGKKWPSFWVFCRKFYYLPLAGRA
jgi:hypothetical protein